MDTQKLAAKIIAKALEDWIPYPPPKAAEIVDALNKRGLVVVRRGG